MDSVDTLFMINRMRHRELIQTSERERLFKIALNNQPGNYGLGVKIIEWIREQFPRNVAREKSLNEQDHTSNPCCSVTVLESE